MSYIHIISYYLIFYSIDIVFLLLLFAQMGMVFHADFPRCHLSFLAWDLGFGKPTAPENRPENTRQERIPPTNSPIFSGFPTLSFREAESQHIWKPPKFSHGVDTNIHNSPNPQLPKFLHLESSENFQWMICRDRGDVPALRY